jgi:REP element-mobilizing transposase RayT
MFHHVARAAPGTLLFRTWEEGLALWRVLVRTLPELTALCVMPDHVHLVLPHADGTRLGRAMAAYARWRNHQRRASGVVWEGHPPAQRLPDAAHLRRTIRYVHLNPCRARLVEDPLSWPLSTHRDRVGFAAPPVVSVDREPARFHLGVSADGTVLVEGTPLPATRHAPTRWDEVRDAVSAVARVPPSALLERGQARTLSLRTAWSHGLRDVAVLSARTGVSRAQVYHLVATVPRLGARLSDPALQACVVAVGDPRFAVLGPGDLRLALGWGRYRARR